MRHQILNSIILLFLSLSANGQTVPELEDKLESHFNDPIFRSSNITAALFDVRSNTLVAGFRPHKLGVPASTLKLFTSYTALKYLGGEYRFSTRIAYAGNIENDGTLKGDLLIIAGGDPTLGSDKIKGSRSFEQLLNHLCAVILASGINCIEGNIIVDASIYDSFPVAPTWQWNDLGNYYATGAWGLNINENQYLIRFKNRQTIGEQAIIHQIYPYVPELKIANEVTVDKAGTGDNAYIFGGPYNFNKRVVGTIPQGKGLFTIKGALPDPPAFFLYHLREKLSRLNIYAQGTKVLFQKDKRKNRALASIQSPQLRDIIEVVNAESNNLYAESILKMTGLMQRGQGSSQNGIAAIQQLMSNYKIPVSDLHFHDGSGLSPRNMISSFALAKFLSALNRDYSMEELCAFLPKGGKEGTVKYMFDQSPARGHVWLKSGSMESVQSYAGYIKSRSGKWLSFAIIINGFQGNGADIRSKLDRIISDIYISS
jgi:D-alanyl-D-alanine carboxypeptidase/D-alanyl-D-alanine-endopeptidase (penicillin-binding protein 4)